MWRIMMAFRIYGIGSSVINTKYLYEIWPGLKWKRVYFAEVDRDIVMGCSGGYLGLFFGVVNYNVTKKREQKVDSW